MSGPIRVQGASPSSTSCLAWRSAASSGFTLVEALVATGIAVTILASLAGLLTSAGAAVRRSRVATAAVVAAADKLEQLRGLDWSYDFTGAERSDTATDTAVVPPAGAGGRGLSDSPAGTLVDSTPGWVDYLDVSGAAIGSGTTPPPGTALVRRWSVRASGPTGMLVVEVCVFRRTIEGERRPEICVAALRGRQP